jgi:hypothetical protein
MQIELFSQWNISTFAEYVRHKKENSKVWQSKDGIVLPFLV